MSIIDTTVRKCNNGYVLSIASTKDVFEEDLKDCFPFTNTVFYDLTKQDLIEIRDKLTEVIEG